MYTQTTFQVATTCSKILLLYTTVVILTVDIHAVSCVSLHTATVTTQPRDVSMCTGRNAVFTCAVNRNGNDDITPDDMMWQHLRKNMSSFNNISGSHPFSITTTINDDILSSKLTIKNVAAEATGLYRCAVPDSDMMSRNASLYVLTSM